MEQDFRVLAQRHLWLSWLWGMYTVWALGLIGGVGMAAFSMFSAFPSSPPSMPAAAYGLLFGFVGTMVFLGMPALLGVLVRRPLMRRLFAATRSRAGLLVGTALVFEASVVLCWLLWEIYTWIFNPLSIRVLPRQHFTSTTLSFFGLSLPWLASSIAAAWWLGRRLFPR